MHGMPQYYCGLTNLGKQRKSKSLVEKMNENPVIAMLVLLAASGWLCLFFTLQSEVYEIIPSYLFLLALKSINKCGNEEKNVLI